MPEAGRVVGTNSAAEQAARWGIWAFTVLEHIFIGANIPRSRPAA